MQVEYIHTGYQGSGDGKLGWAEISSPISPTQPLPFSRSALQTESRSEADSSTPVSPSSDPEKGDPISAKDTAPFTIFSKRQRAFIVLIITVAASFSSLASNIYIPSLTRISGDLNVEIQLVNFSVASYLIMQAFAPILWGALADRFGRRIIYIICFSIFFGSCLRLAFVRNIAELIVFRSIQSSGSGAAQALGSAVLGDITTRQQRGGYMGFYMAGLLSPYAFGPVIGGTLADHFDWASVFYFMAVYSALFLVLLSTCFPETLRSLVGNGSYPKEGFLRYPLYLYQKSFAQQCPEIPPQTKEDLPPRMKLNLLGSFYILFDLRLFPLLFIMSIFYAAWMMMAVAVSKFFVDVYGLTETQLGLAYLPNGAGIICGTILTGQILNRDFRSHKRACDASGQEIDIAKARLQRIWIWASMSTGSVLMFAWSLHYRIPIAVPMISTFITGWAAFSIQGTVQTYLVDIYPERSASAGACVNLTRCNLGAVGCAVALPLCERIGVGWGFTTVGGVQLVALGLFLLQLYLRRRSQQVSEQPIQEKED